MALDRDLLYFFVRDAIKGYSENARIVGQANPVQIILNNNRYSVHISYVHDSGNARDNDDEVRIQLGRLQIEQQRDRQQLGEKVAFIGFFSSGDAFIAWDPRHVFSLQAAKVVSIYARQSQRESVYRSQAAVHQFRAKFLGEESFAIALPSSALGFYLENINRFHSLRTERAIVDLMGQHAETYGETGLGASGEIPVVDGAVRERFSFTRTAFPRDPRFAKWVLDAYGQTCCICARQLGLVQAAHIIPHSVQNSPNDVTNGLALCIEHHRLYDDALLLPGPGYRLVFNERRADYLHQIRQDRGLEAIRELNGRPFTVPLEADRQPRDDYLRQGLQLRMGT